MTAFKCQLDGRPVELGVERDGLLVDGEVIAYVDVDGVRIEGHTVTLDVFGRGPVVISMLGAAQDTCLHELLPARASARRAALLQWSGDAPIDSYVARPGGVPVDVHLFADALTVEPLDAAPTIVPLSLIEHVEREGYVFHLVLRAVPPVSIGQLGPRTDEWLADLEEARRQLQRDTLATYASLDPALEGFGAPDGWAVDEAGAGRWWAPLRAAVAGEGRGAEVDVLERLSAGGLRLGVKRQHAGEPLPFALAVGHGKVAVEGTDADARATYVFRTDDVARLNVALLLTSFRREALYLPEAELGRWALAARTLEVVQWARSALVGRVVHDASWEADVTAALS